ncbi:hypothetical protein ACRARG_17280 [Pseudooceanicola sp. C21-150M6]|uniref:hypothetical protein n=1 Tax=Pseudooceanicola sp. C21-150M6 TaxID=3434355 RepID=UPI003D7FE0DA
MADLIYIIGSGRSGSTVMERILNTAPRVVGVGEIHALWRLPVETLLCSCGKRVPECSFWQEALGHADIGPAELARLAELETSVVRNKYLMTLRYNLDRIRADDRLAEFIDLQRRLFDGTRKAGGGDVVLDSSKAGPRAWVLAAGLSPVFLHAYRAAEDVIASWRRPKFEPSTNSPMKKPPIREAAADWIKVEQAARSLSRKSTLRRIDYPDFSRHPKAALERALEPDFPGLAGEISWVSENSVRPSENYHSVLGNPDRFSREDIVIRPQHATDRSKFAAPERIAIQLIGKGLQAIYS